jgi:hypothetical protein
VSWFLLQVSWSARVHVALDAFGVGECLSLLFGWKGALVVPPQLITEGLIGPVDADQFTIDDPTRTSYLPPLDACSRPQFQPGTAVFSLDVDDYADFTPRTQKELSAIKQFFRC